MLRTCGYCAVYSTDASGDPLVHTHIDTKTRVSEFLSFMTFDTMREFLGGG